MNAHPQAEAPEAGARRLFAGKIREGFAPVALHRYCQEDGTVSFYRPRLKHPDGRKYVRAIRLDGLCFVMGEPPKPPGGGPLYRRPELAANLDATVWVVEGEGCADLLAKLGKVATTSGSATSADAADWKPLRGRDVIVWPDNDKPGRDYGDKVAATLLAQGCTVRIVEADSLALPEGGDVVDWLAANPDGDLDTLPIRKIREMRSTPEPLRRPTPPSKPYPLAELGSILEPAAASLSRVIQAPDAICAASLLAASSLATQALADVHIDGREIPLSLWMLTVAESGERKTAVDMEAMRAARQHEKRLVKAYEADLRFHASKATEYEARLADAKKAAHKRQGRGLAEALDALGSAPSPPLLPRLLVSDFTGEGLNKLLAVGHPGVGAFADEGGLVFGGHGMTHETTTRTVAMFSKLWDGGTLDRVRALDGATKLYGRRLAMHLLAQPVIAERALSDPVLAGQGFLARCLLSWPEPTAGRRSYRAECLRDDPALLRLHERLAELHATPYPLAEGERQELEPRALRLTDAAKAAWIELHDAVERAMRDGGRFACVKPWASKAAEQALRIAGVLTLLENPAATTIDAATVQRAGDIALWHLGEAVRLAGTATLSEEVLDAEALLKWCHDTGRDLLASSEALRLGPNRIRELDSFNQAVDVLVGAGWATPIHGGAEVAGCHRKRVWRITPAADGD